MSERMDERTGRTRAGPSLMLGVGARSGGGGNARRRDAAIASPLSLGARAPHLSLAHTLTLTTPTLE
jgi:hypothetical protein